MVTCLTAVCEILGLNLTVYLSWKSLICSLGCGLHTITAVPRSNHPSTFQYQLVGQLIRNSDGGFK